MRRFSLKYGIWVAAIPVAIYAFTYGPDAGASGVPGESTCAAAACHPGPANAPQYGGSVTVFLPQLLTYTPGRKQHLVVTVADPLKACWGFQLSCRRTDDSRTQAGSFLPGSDGFTQVMCTTADRMAQALSPCPASMPLQYVQHTLPGLRRGQIGQSTFEFDWLPPAGNVGDVTVYVAAVAAGVNDQMPAGRVYVNTYRLSWLAEGQRPKPLIASPPGVLNGASFTPGLSPGGWASVFGTNLSLGTRAWTPGGTNSGWLPTTLEGVSVVVGGKPAYLSYISPVQINFQVPDVDQGPVNFQVVNNGVISDSIPVAIQGASPALFLWANKYVVATHLDWSLVGRPGIIPGRETVPARPGETIALWLNGLGPAAPVVPAGMLAPFNPVSLLAGPCMVRIGGVPAPVLGAALSPGSAGLYQINLTVPDSLPDGDYPVEVEVGGASSPAGAVLSLVK